MKSGETRVCATPTISYVDGKLQFPCETDGTACYYQLNNSDVRTSYTFAKGKSVGLTACYDIKCFALATGYNQSETATAKLYWLAAPDVDAPTNITSISTRGIIIQSAGGMLTISGLKDGENVKITVE